MLRGAKVAFVAKKLPGGIRIPRNRPSGADPEASGRPGRQSAPGHGHRPGVGTRCNAHCSPAIRKRWQRPPSVSVESGGTRPNLRPKRNINKELIHESDVKQGVFRQHNEKSEGNRHQTTARPQCAPLPLRQSTPLCRMLRPASRRPPRAKRRSTDAFALQCLCSRA